MGTVIALPARPRIFNAVRSALRERAKHNHASDIQFRHALGVAFGLMRDGASSAWAIQAGCQDMRGQASHAYSSGPEAA